MARVERLRAAVALTALVVALAVAFLAGTAGPAYADCSAVMTFQFDPTAGGAVLQPDRLTVSAGSCVTLHNATVTSADFTVGGFHTTVAAFGSAVYPASSAGTTQPVAATGPVGTARGTIVIRPRPAHATPTPAPTPTRTRSPQPAGATPSSAPAAVAAPSASPTATPRTRTNLPASAAPAAPSGSPLPSAPAAVPSPSPSAVVVAGPLQPPTDRGTGLPAALAALAVVATAAALLRVLLAEPVPGSAVDGRDSVGAAV